MARKKKPNIAYIVIEGEIGAIVSCAVQKDVATWLLDKSQRPDAVAFLLNSQGGDVNCAIAILNMIATISHMGIKTISVVTGEAFSAAFFIHQACDARLMFPNTNITAHKLTHNWMDMSVSQSERTLDSLKIFAVALLDTLPILPKKTYDEIRDILFGLGGVETQSWTPTKAELAGLLDDIIFGLDEVEYFAA